MGSLSNTCEGTSGVAFSNSNSAGPNQFNAVTVTGTGTTLTFDNTQFHAGATAARFSLATVASTAFLDWSALPNTPTANGYVRFYAYLTALPSVNAVLCKFLDGASVVSSIQLQTTGIIRTLNSAGGTIGSLTESFPLNQWVRVEFEVTGISGTNGTVALRIFSGSNLETANPDSGGSISNSSSSVTGTITDLRVGTSSSVTQVSAFTYWYDDIAYSDVATPGPAPPAVAVPGRRPPVVVASRTAARGWFAALAAPANAAPTAAIPGKVPPHILVRRRRSARAWWRGTVVSTVNAVPQPGTVPPHVVVARRTAARALWAGFVSRTVNVFPVAFQVARSIASVAATAPAVPVTLQVTATQGGSTQNGLLLRVVVLTSAAAAQNGATATAAAGSASITTTQAGSRVYGAALRGAAAANSPVAGCTLIDDVQDGAHGVDYSTWKTSAATSTPGAATVGCSFGLAVAALEVLAAGTLTEDASGPAVASTLTATAVSTAVFTPPAGSLLIALASSDGAGSVTTMTVSGGGLAWAEQVKQNPAGNGYVGVWTAALAPARASSTAAVTATDTSTPGVS